MFPLYAWWLPQILQSAWADVRPPLKPAYVAGTSAARLALPLYLFACPHNLLRSPPCYPVAAALVLFVGAQVGASSVNSHLRHLSLLPPSSLLLIPPALFCFALSICAHVTFRSGSVLCERLRSRLSSHPVTAYACGIACACAAGLGFSIKMLIAAPPHEKNLCTCCTLERLCASICLQNPARLRDLEA